MQEPPEQPKPPRSALQQFRNFATSNLAATLALTALNLSISWRLLKLEYINQFSSVEGFFIGIVRFLSTHWGDWSWFPLWHCGIPYQDTYVPLLHLIAAATASFGHLPPGRAYHAVVGIAYALGAPALYWMAIRLGAPRGAALLSALCYSLYSPSALIMPDVAKDLGGYWYSRRLQVMTVYGEGPHVTAMTLLPIVILSLEHAIRRRTPRSLALAAITMASVFLTNIPGTMALGLAVYCWIWAQPPGRLRAAWRTAAVAAVLAYCVACYGIPPSSMFRVGANVGDMHRGFTRSLQHGPIYLILTLAAVALASALLARVRLPWKVPIVEPEDVEPGERAASDAFPARPQISAQVPPVVAEKREPRTGDPDRPLIARPPLPAQVRPVVADKLETGDGAHGDALRRPLLPVQAPLNEPPAAVLPARPQISAQVPPVEPRQPPATHPPIPLIVRFALLFGALTGGMAATAKSETFELLPQVGRLHLEFEIGACLLIGCTLWALYTLQPRWTRPIFLAMCVVPVFVQYGHYRWRAHLDTERPDLVKRSEYTSARWLDAHLPAGRVYATGGTSFWLNAIARSPQLTGCCDQGQSMPVLNEVPYKVNSIEGSNTTESGIAWLRALGVQALVVNGPQSTDEYKDIHTPERFDAALPLLHRENGDAIYQVLPPTASLAHVVRAEELVPHRPPGKYMYPEILRYAQATTDPERPPATLVWQRTNQARLRATLSPGDLLSVQVSWFPGWKATLRGRPVPISSDGMGFIVLQPQCEGDCEISLAWTGRADLLPSAIVSLLTLSLLAAMLFRRS